MRFFMRMRFFMILAWELKVKNPRNNTATFTCTHCCLSFSFHKLTVLSFAPQMDPVQKAVINHTFGVSIPPKKKQVISCNVCQFRFNSDVSITFPLLSVVCQLGVWLFWTCTSLHITYLPLEAHLLWATGPFISVC